LDTTWKEKVRQIDFTASTTNNYVQVGNSSLHDREGQNILFNDGHAEFSRRSDVSVNNDNIYTKRQGSAAEIEWRGGQAFKAMFTEGYSVGSVDTLLVYDNVCQ